MNLTWRWLIPEVEVPPSEGANLVSDQIQFGGSHSGHECQVIHSPVATNLRPMDHNVSCQGPIHTREGHQLFLRRLVHIHILYLHGKVLMNSELEPFIMARPNNFRRVNTIATQSPNPL